MRRGRAHEARRVGQRDHRHRHAHAHARVARRRVARHAEATARNRGVELHPLEAVAKGGHV
eukprot:2699548-Prymnesium_polylepis.3